MQYGTERIARQESLRFFVCVRVRELLVGRFCVCVCVVAVSTVLLAVCIVA